jgi:hypothetical protein
MIKEIISQIFNTVSYWNEKEPLLKAIPLDYYKNKNILIRLLGIRPENVMPKNEAKRDMWNHHVVHNYMGDDIMQNVDKKLLEDEDFARQAIEKYNRAYIFLPKRLKANQELAKLAAIYERPIEQSKHNLPILHYMPPIYQADHEISVLSTTRNIENLQYAQNLKSNKYFIYDMMRLSEDRDTKNRILQLIDQELLQDKKFVSRLKCYDNLCENFQGDAEYVAQACQYDLTILRKTQLFNEKIIRYALKNKEEIYSRGEILVEVFRYIEKFNHTHHELFEQIKDEEFFKALFWEMAETLSEEYI